MIVFISTFISPHVKPFCDYIYEKTNGEFRYIQTMKLTEERKALGYGYDEKIPYLIDCTDDAICVKDLIDTAECVIINPGSADVGLVRKRIKNNLITFFMTERVFKRGIIKLADPKFWKQAKVVWASRRKNLYLLCMGSFVGKDFRLFGFCKNKIYRFGYFPEIFHKDFEKSVNEKIELIWAGRFISCKRPKMVLKIVKELKECGKDVHLSMVGDGVLYCKIKKNINKYKLQDSVTLCGKKSNSDLLEMMAKSDVLLCTSNRREGWGAVINEALSSGTPVVSSDKAGAAAYLIKNGYNGYIFSKNNIKEAISYIQEIINNSTYYRENAKKMIELWNSKIAGERFLEVLKEIKKNNFNNIYEEGPMSKEE